MFDKAIIDTDKFMDLSMTAKAMYFLLGMEADDEGFVSYKKVLRIHGGNEDDVKILVAKNFLLSFPSGVVVVTDWNVNNYLDKNRIRKTEYQTEKAMLYLTPDKKYGFNNGLTSIEESRGEENIYTETSSEYEIVSDLEEEKKPQKPKPPQKVFHNLKLIEEVRGLPFGRTLNYHAKIYNELLKDGWSDKVLVQTFVELIESDYWREQKQFNSYPGMNTVQSQLRNKKPV